ncbi:thioredoxin domain-containing protein [Candidatus Marsarchaeota G2 archaeon ECH_B_2]|uniref:Thioredoxin domain-containing protein n=4 Tax=Candidatus Marsarchaeota group 2 TaxID=2203771 RepID=A0A2R6BCP2_9ARCH|nr:MAG: thioredoxin domain-containing protein [Candidatus Marsarchaeota G2 archaeon ECH_B_2]PSO01108.1 MAG: thioredoxin domain-containing protein [Candidatus Marsarchaeota G2 archaeon ECH_B_3]PSO03007.1 MAG: thioredoxin domain-containing protein [Candidatus Marsarchaeota G2 archaeon ECH_B_1]
MNANSGLKPNRLINEKSPYLLQHAYNPVDWYPWCEEAFERARREDKPVFLSIGYSTCHWCHVMAEESFEDPEVAKLLNDAFVCIKVDREERPDIDAVYMNVCQLMTGSGGWPLTVIMTPDKKPFFAATYIPKSSRFGMTGLTELVPRIKDLWLNRRSEVVEASQSVLTALRANTGSSSKTAPGERVLKSAYTRLYEEFDETHGGFGLQPKFPMTHRLSFLLRYYKRYGDRGALYMVERTLQRIRYGGVYDQVGFGLHRYSTDQRWMVPHFEKMLYDQAAACLAYTEAFQVTGEAFYLDVVRELFEFTCRELGSDAGGFYTALDADSEGVEGKFYLWSWGELYSLLSESQLRLLKEYYGVKEDGNIESPEGLGKMNILHAERSVEEYAADRGVDPTRVKAELESIRRTLFEARSRRVRPHRDEKILADLNGYMIAALAKGSSTMGSREYLNAAERAAGFILTNMKSDDGGLYHTHSGGVAYVDGLLNDCAFMVWGLIELYQATLKTEHLKQALILNDYMLKHFWDDANGGFYMTADNSEETLIRPKEYYDGAIPSGNSVALANLLRLSRITGNTSYEEKAYALLESVGAQLEANPEGFTQLLCALDFALGPTHEVVIVGERRSQTTNRLLEELRRRFVPNHVIILREPYDEEIAELCPYTKDMGGAGREALVYVCSNHSCNMPTDSVGEVLRQLGEKVV